MKPRPPTHASGGNVAGRLAAVKLAVNTKSQEVTRIVYGKSLAGWPFTTTFSIFAIGGASGF